VVPSNGRLVSPRYPLWYGGRYDSSLRTGSAGASACFVAASIGLSAAARRAAQLAFERPVTQEFTAAKACCIDDLRDVATNTKLCDKQLQRSTRLSAH